MSAFLQVLAVTFTFRKLFVTASSFSDSVPPFLRYSPLDAISVSSAPNGAVWEAVSEAVLALVVFGVASCLLRVYRKCSSKNGKTHECWAPAKPAKPSHPRSTQMERRHQNFKKTVSDAPCSRGAKDDAAPRVKTVPIKQVSLGKQTNADADHLAAEIKAGNVSKLPDLLDSACRRAKLATEGSSALLENVSCELLLVALRACAAARCFKEAVAAYSHMEDRIGKGNGAIWSVLLYNIVEAGAFHRCKEVFTNLCKHSAPSGHDVVNVVRCYAACKGKRNSEHLQPILADLRNAGHSIDVYTLNRALAACHSSNTALDLAEELIKSEICPQGLDAVGYNTLMKYSARAGRLARCFELRSQMFTKGIELSEITYGILLDACVGVQNLDSARKVFDDLCASGLRMNVVHCTTFLKGLIAAGHLDEAAGVLHEMSCSSGVQPDLIAYSTVVKAYAEIGNVSSALKVLDQMMLDDVKPDEIIFNSVLHACCIFPLKSSDVLAILEVLVTHGLQPTTTTLSILLKALALTNAYSVSLQMLDDAPAKFGFIPEMRLYGQLARACLKAREMDAARCAFNAMLKATKTLGTELDSTDVIRLIRNCALEGNADLAVEFQQAAEHIGIVLDMRVDKILRSAIAKQNQVGQSVRRQR